MPSASDPELRLDPDEAAPLVRVRPDIVSVDREFDYSIPPTWIDDGRADRIRIGSLVRIDFHGRRVAGWVTQVDVEPAPGIDIRPLAKLSSYGPPPDLVDLARWAAWRWAGRVPHFLRAASPPRMVGELGSPIEVGAVESDPRLADAFRRPGSAEHDGAATLIRTLPADDGSGLALAAASFGSALIVAPTIGQRDRIAATLRSAGVPVAVYPEQWARAAQGAVTVGTRSAAWAPVPSPRAFLLLDEHDSALKEERTPAWNARDVVMERARRADAPCVLASPSPSLEALEAADRRLVPERSAERNGWPPLEVVDLRTQDRPGLLTESLVPVLRSMGPIACVLNRKGRARLLGCAACGSVAACEACGAAVTQPDDDHLVCPVDGTSRPIVCDNCGGLKMKLLRPGISRLAEDLRALAKREVVEVTAESAAGDLDGDRLFIGTEALLRRLNTARAVVFLDFDQELSVPRTRAAEDAFALLALAARRLGPRDSGGRLIVQTRRPDHLVIEAALHGDADRVARPQREIRRVFRQPPYGAWAIVGGAGAAEFIESVRGRLDIHRLGDEWRLSAAGHEELLDVLADTPRPAGRVRIEVDPINR